MCKLKVHNTAILSEQFFSVVFLGRVLLLHKQNECELFGNCLFGKNGTSAELKSASQKASKVTINELEFPLHGK